MYQLFVMEQQTYDFIAETNGHCFLCSQNISFSNAFKSESESFTLSSSSIHSLHYLSRYLNVDMRKVFTGDGPIPSHLVDRVKKSRLKAELCEGCAKLTKKFSKLYRQLKKVEMEVESCLEGIHMKLEKAATLDNRNSGSTDEWAAKLEISEALRQDVRQKCSRKLGAVRPITRLQRLTSAQVNAEKLKIESMKVATKIVERSTQNQHPESNYEDVDMQSPASVSGSNGDRNDYLDEAEDFTYSTIQDEPFLPEPEIVKQEVMEGNPISDGMELDVDIKTETVSGQQQPISTANDFDIEHQQRFRTNVKNIEANQLSQAIPPAIKVKSGDGTVEKPDAIRNPKTGKYQCSSCPREYALISGFRYHYKSAHLKVRFKCGICKKEFSFKQHYETHYLSVHMGVRFKCVKCEKSFRNKSSLMKHQKNHHHNL